MKTIQALSWALFCAFAIALIVLFQLAHQAQRWGRYQIWSEPIRGPSPYFKLAFACLLLIYLFAEMPWFGEPPGFYPGMMMPYPQSPGAYYPPPMFQPGNSIIIQPGVNGAPATVTQVPG